MEMKFAVGAIVKHISSNFRRFKVIKWAEGQDRCDMVEVDMNPPYKENKDTPFRDIDVDSLKVIQSAKNNLNDFPLEEE